ncbi:aldose 1-epimerase [Spirosoma montaniterrae]|uniref:Aldose epimerase n=1 Tax=Spirosoma montaniterrae TaxID=1178516 RepID=A0A1P9WSA6_9BACT|nr:aldose epimerase [Spirosoma montaniterrae]AQG78230.1 aldose epimerase [Spirosoma montaniterrae]
MPFQITTQPFGTLPDETEPLIEYVLEHTETGEFATIIPGFGAVLRRLVLRRNDDVYALIKAPDSAQSLFADESYASALLYPFPSRIRHGIYRFEGEDYALAMNEVSRDNALHGFVHGRVFSVISQETTPNYARLTLRYDYAGDTVGYPFPFSLTMVYELALANRLLLGSHVENDQMCALRVSYAALNTGPTPCPAAFGWHPYFTFTEEPIDDLTLSLPARSQITLNDSMLPSGKQPLENAETFSLRDRELDTPFAVEPTGIPAVGQPFAETVLTSTKTGAKLIVGQQTGAGKLNYLVCYTPGRRDSIAIEPQTASVDAFNNGDGLAVLNPGDVLSGSMWVRLV